MSVPQATSDVEGVCIVSSPDGNGDLRLDKGQTTLQFVMASRLVLWQNKLYGDISVDNELEERDDNDDDRFAKINVPGCVGL